METKIYNQLPDEAKEIRLEVFVKSRASRRSSTISTKRLRISCCLTAVTPSESAAFSQTPGAAGS